MADEISTSLDQTIAALRGGVRQLAIEAAVPVIDDWQQRLSGSGSPELMPIADNLAELSSQLSSGNFDPSTVGQLLDTLGTQVQQATLGGPGEQVADRLQQLSTLLTSEGRSLSS